MVAVGVKIWKRKPLLQAQSGLSQLLSSPQIEKPRFKILKSSIIAPEREYQQRLLAINKELSALPQIPIEKVQVKTILPPRQEHKAPASLTKSGGMVLPPKPRVIPISKRLKEELQKTETELEKIDKGYGYENTDKKQH